MQNQAVIIVLTVLMNTLGGITAASLFKPGSVAFVVVSIAGLIVGNALAIFGRPMAKRADSEEPKDILPGELGKFAFLPILFAGAMLMSGCSTAGGKAFTACELGKLPSAAQTAWATVQDITSNPDSTQGDLIGAALALVPGQLDCAAKALLAWLDGLAPARKMGMALMAPVDPHEHAKTLLRAYLAGKTASCGIRVAEIEEGVYRPLVLDDDVPEWTR